MAIVTHHVDGRLACTVEQLAERHAIPPSSVRVALARFDPPLRPAAPLDGRKDLYYPEEFAAALQRRPGRGVNLRRPPAAGR